MRESLRIRDKLRALLGFALVILSAGETRAGSVALESAMYSETVLGDLKGAMRQYRTILADPSAGREQAARAAWGLAQCLEKSGRRLEAREAYAQAAQFVPEPWAAKAKSVLAGWDYAGPGPVNLRFTQGDAGKLPAGWLVPALPPDADQWAQRRSGAACRSGTSCAVVMAPPLAPLHSSNLSQSFSARAYRGKTVRVRAWVRVDAVDAADRAQLWLSVDGARPFLDDMAGRPIRSSEWTMAEIRAPVDGSAETIKFGVMSIGRGKAWVDGVAFEVVP